MPLFAPFFILFLSLSFNSTCRRDQMDSQKKSMWIFVTERAFKITLVIFHTYMYIHRDTQYKWFMPSNITNRREKKRDMNPLWIWWEVKSTINEVKWHHNKKGFSSRSLSMMKMLKWSSSRGITREWIDSNYTHMFVKGLLEHATVVINWWWSIENFKFLI